MALDLIIPLQAAARWLDGGTVYLADAFANAQLLPPFLYPPFVLPVVAPLTLVPEELVRWGWLAPLDRAGGTGRASPGDAVVADPAPGALGADARCDLGWQRQHPALRGVRLRVLARSRRHDLRAVPVDIDAHGAVTPRIGFLAAAVASVKASQVQPWLAVLRRSPRSALVGIVPWVGLVLVTLPLVGVALYGDWLAQVGRASDAAWPAMGPSLLAYLPGGVFLGLTLASFVLALWLRGPDTAAWLGLLILIVTPNMHDSSALFMLPAMLLVRREFALLAVILTTTHTYQGWWLGIAIVGFAMLVGIRWPTFRQAGRQIPAL